MKDNKTYKTKKIILNRNICLPRIYRILVTILDWTLGLTPNEKLEIRTIFFKIQRLWRECGLTFTITYLKAARLQVTRFISGDPLIEKGHQNVKISIDKDGYPLIYKGFKHLAVSNKRWDVVKLFTIITISRAIRRDRNDKLKINLEVIEGKSTAKYKTLDPHILEKVIKKMGIPKLVIKDFSGRFPIYNSAGPDGSSTRSAWMTIPKFGISLLTSLLHLTGNNGRLYLLSNFLFNTLNPVRRLIPSIINFIEKNKLAISSLGMLSLLENNGYTRKLAIVEDPELKARVIAIYDHYSQAVLEKLSDQVFPILRGIPSDRTYTQSPLFTHTGYVKTDDMYHSFDLTSATDRFPIDLQKQILKMLQFPAVDDWANVMVGQVFEIPISWNWNLQESVEYKVGQPMGARTSWPVFTLAHHITVRYCAWLAGKPDFHNYIILGDDIVIHDNKVAAIYKGVIAGLGVELSSNKSHVSKHIYEFAKRWVHLKIGEVSPIPLSGISDNISDIGTLYMLLYDLVFNRNLFQFKSSFTHGFCCWYNSLCEWSFDKKYIHKYGNPIPVKYQTVKRLMDRVQPYTYYLSWISDRLTYDQMRNLLTRFLPDFYMANKNPPYITDYEYTTVIPGDMDKIQKIINNSLTSVIIRQFERAISKIDEINSQINSDIFINHFNPWNPMNLGYQFIKNELIKVSDEFRKTNKEDIPKALDILLSLDPDNFSNRESTSPTKKRRATAKFARNLFRDLGNSQKNTDWLLYGGLDQERLRLQEERMAKVRAFQLRLKLKSQNVLKNK